MLQFLLPFLLPGAEAAVETGLAGALGAGTAGLMGGGALTAGASAIGPTLANAAALGGGGTGIMGALTKLAPNAVGMGQNLARGNIQGAAGNLGAMVGGQNLGNMIANPSMSNLGNLAEGMGDKFITNSLVGNQQPQQKPVGPGAMVTRQKMSTPTKPQTDIQDPILKRMYQNLNGVRQMTTQTASPYPRKMSSI